MPRTTQLTVSLASRPGVLAQLATTLADAGVNITSLSADAVSGRGKIRLIVNNPAKARRALRKAKYRVSEEPAYVVRMRNKPGSLARVTGKLAKARVNIKSAYATTAGRGAAVVITVGSNAKARKILR
ncbi:MAG: ACT domain-containing protein [Candidatus Rokubacteria bacterium]|nr:ACT domain-containing protein [Candidatus Rokubacteria bacterium]